MSRDDDDPVARESVRDFALPHPRQSAAVPESKGSRILIPVTVAIAQGRHHVGRGCDPRLTSSLSCHRPPTFASIRFP